jgi:predicted nucleic acid-binding protein
VSEQRLNDFLESVLLLGMDEETAKIFGRERGRLRAAGMMISDMALLIAATALHDDLTLLTNNRNHFECIEGLRIESH